MPFTRKIDDGSEGDDAEGHAVVRPRGLDDGSEGDDTEGHGIRVRTLSDGSEGDDTEGHAAKLGSPRRRLRGRRHRRPRAEISMN